AWSAEWLPPGGASCRTGTDQSEFLTQMESLQKLWSRALTSTIPAKLVRKKIRPSLGYGSACLLRVFRDDPRSRAGIRFQYTLHGATLQRISLRDRHFRCRTRHYGKHQGF